MAATETLAPFTAIRLAWAIAGKFSSQPEGKLSAQVAEQTLKDISARAGKDPKEQSYVSQSEATIQAAIRGLEIILKGRNLNFDENEKLRKAYMENVQEGIQFGSKAKDYLKALPTMAIAGPGVTSVLGPTLADLFGIEKVNQTLFLWGFGAAMAGLGYLIYSGFVLGTRKRTQQLYVAHDYERNLYYEHYITRVKATLTGLYLDIDRLHKQTFGNEYPLDGIRPENVVNNLLQGVAPTMCRHVHKHMAAGIVKPECWVLCEVGEPRSEDCAHWGKK